MARYGVSITKTMLWHGREEEYDNTYYYEGPDAAPDAVGLRAFVDVLVAEEKAIHGTSVTFKRARIWTAGGTKLQNVTLALFDLSGTGTQIGARLLGESAYQVEWECERVNVLGRKVYLRKFIRPGNAIASAGPDSITGQYAHPPAVITVLKEFGNDIQTIAAPAGINWQLCSPSGRLPRVNDNAQVNPFMSTREFRRN